MNWVQTHWMDSRLWQAHVSLLRKCQIHFDNHKCCCMTLAKQPWHKGHVSTPKIHNTVYEITIVIYAHIQKLKFSRQYQQNKARESIENFPRRFSDCRSSRGLEIPVCRQENGEFSPNSARNCSIWTPRAFKSFKQLSQTRCRRQVRVRGTRGTSDGVRSTKSRSHGNVDRRRVGVSDFIVGLRKAENSEKQAKASLYERQKRAKAQKTFSFVQKSVKRNRAGLQKHSHASQRVGKCTKRPIKASFGFLAAKNGQKLKPRYLAFCQYIVGLPARRTQPAKQSENVASTATLPWRP